MVKILILGSTGMLGNVVTKYFQDSNMPGSEKYKIYVTHRGNINLQADSIYFDALNPDFEKLPEVDYIINCIGIIKPFMSQDIEKSIYINSIFPHKLSKYYETTKTKIIHITTDCVFSGNSGNYDEDSQHDCLDDYGKSKSLGEPKNCMVLRTSIIGTEIHKNASLISWAISQKDKKVNGFTNHLWNGVTTKEYARCCQKIIDNDYYEVGLKHLFSNSVNKKELLNLISDKFDLNLDITPVETPVSCDRTLKTKFELCKILNIKPLEEQIKEL